MKLEVRCHNQIYTDSIEIAVFVNHDNGKVSVAEKLTLVDFDPNSYLVDPTMRLKRDEAQFLMDELWKCGLRPSEGSGSAGSLAATEKHLKDMQTIAIGLLRKDGVAI